MISMFHMKKKKKKKGYTARMYWQVELLIYENGKILLIFFALASIY